MNSNIFMHYRVKEFAAHEGRLQMERNELPNDSNRISVRRTSSNELFLLTIAAQPTPDSDEYDEAGGAYITCWVNSEDLQTAERRAIALVEEHGWHSIRFEKWELVTRNTYIGREPRNDGGPDLLDVVNQAFIDGEVAIFHTWPVDAPDMGNE